MHYFPSYCKQTKDTRKTSCAGIRCAVKKKSLKLWNCETFVIKNRSFRPSKWGRNMDIKHLCTTNPNTVQWMVSLDLEKYGRHFTFWPEVTSFLHVAVFHWCCSNDNFGLAYGLLLWVFHSYLKNGLMFQLQFQSVCLVTLSNVMSMV